MIRFVTLLMLSTATASAMPADVKVCFTPGENCEAEIAQAIDGAQTEVRVQAYTFTSTLILVALRHAIRRGVHVAAILDKTNDEKRYDAALYLSLAGADVMIDDKVAIAHNKVMVIDRHLVIGGSFNYTRSAQQRNAENVTFTESRDVAARFLANWEARMAVSRLWAPPEPAAAE